MTDVQPLANVLMERDVIGRIIAFRASYPSYVATQITRSDFYRQAHQELWDIIATVYARGEEINLISVRLELQRQGLLEAVGGDYYLNSLTNDILPISEATMLLEAAELATLAAKRELSSAIQRSDLQTLAEVLERNVTRAANERRSYDSAGQLRSILEDIARDEQGTISLGFPTLDGILGGLRSGEVFGLMARPGIGKTLVFCQVARAVADTAFGHVFFSLEMPAAQISERIARGHYGLSRNYLRQRLQHGGLASDEYVETFRRFHVVDAPGLSVAQMGAKLRQLQASTLKDVPIRLITVDHLGLIGGDRKMSTYDRVSTQARELKELAKRFDASVVLAVQVNRESGGDGSKELHLGSARDSGVVEEAMDYLVSMRRPERSQTLSAFERERYRDTLFLKVIKNRHGAPDTEIGVRIDGMTLRLTEDAELKIDDGDLSKIASMQLRGRR